MNETTKLEINAFFRMSLGAFLVGPIYAYFKGYGWTGAVYLILFILGMNALVAVAIHFVRAQNAK
jgi:hypothetical protein